MFRWYREEKKNEPDADIVTHSRLPSNSAEPIFMASHPVATANLILHTQLPHHVPRILLAFFVRDEKLVR